MIHVHQRDPKTHISSVVENFRSFVLRCGKKELSTKKKFYGNLTTESITNANYKHARRVWEDFGLQNLGQNYHMYVQIHALLFTDVFESFKNKCLRIYGLDPVHFLSTLGLVWQACLKKTGVELELLTDTDISLMVEKDIKDRI